MAACRLKYGIPDIALQRLEAGLLNPSDLAGRDFVIVFCGADTAEAVEEIQAYRNHAAAFEHAGVWVIGVLSDRNVDLPQRREGEAQIALTVDPASEAWCAFQALLDPAERSSSAKGGAFLFGRGGCLVRAWAGSGHASAILSELGA